MNAFTPQEPIYGLPRTHGAPCPRLLARAQSLRADAAEIAWAMSQTPTYQRTLIDNLIRQHTALTMRAIAAEHIARGEEVLGKHYLRSARRLEAEA